MAGFIELIAKIKPKNNGKYALVDDVDVEMEDGTRLSEAIKKPKIPDGGNKGQLLAKKSDNNGDAEWIDGLKMEDVDKKLETKLDKNLGSENPDKVLTTDTKGNIVLQDKEDFEGSGVTNYNDLNNKPSINGVTLTDNKTSADLDMYTQEEVDDLLYEKMDKPYAPITISDDTTIEDCLDGYFKIDKILGNTYQAEESDIVPTPQRPIPINSRKTTITKVNPNIFDLEKESDTSNIPDSGTYRSVGQYQLKANTKYIFEWLEATVPVKATLSFQIQDDKGTVLVSPFTYFNLEATEKKETGKQVEFTTNESGIIKFAYNCTVATSSTTETYQQYWYTKILRDIALKEDVEYESEYVELRSLKESKNLFDNRLFTLLNSDYFALNDDGTGIKVIREEDRSVENIQYEIPIRGLFYCHFMCSGGLTITIHCLEEGVDEWRMVRVCSSDDTDITFSVGNQNPAKLKFEIHSSVSTETANIALYSYGVADETKYIPPTVRDYKIVDHANKAAKIVRNVGLYVDDHTGNKWSIYDNSLYPNSYLIQLKDMKTSYRVLSFCNSFNPVNDNTGINNPNSMWIGVNGTVVFIIKTNFKTLDEWKEWLKNNDLEWLYPLAIPVEETIAYSADDTSEVGYSWQDTTSPSPTIKSEAQGVEGIDILKTGKNLFDIEGHEFTTNLQYGNVSANKIVKVNNTTLRIQNPNTESYAVGDKFVVKANDPLIISFDVLEITGTEQINVVFYKETGSLLKSFEYRTIKVGTRFVIDTPITAQNNYVYIGFQSVNAGSIVTISNILLEYASIATEYEPYKEQHINITLPQPMYSTADKKISDIANIENKQYEYYLKKIVFDGTNAMFKYLSNSNNVFYTSFPDDAISPYDISYKYILCEDLTVYTSSFTTDNFVDNSIKYGNGSGTSKLLFIKINDTITTADMLYMWLKEHPFTVYYVVQTPTTQPIPEEDLAKLKSLKTSAGVNNIFINGEVKPTIEARYALDIASIVSKLQTKLLTLQEEVVKNV